MRTNIEFHNCPESEMALVQEHWLAKEADLDERMKSGNVNPEEAQLDLHVCCEPWATRHSVRAVLSLPSAKLTAEALDEDVFSALDRVAELLSQVAQHQVGISSSAEGIDEVEGASADSFPASDAPAWTHIST